MSRNCVCVCVCVFKSRRASLRHTFVPRGFLKTPQYRSKKKNHIFPLSYEKPPALFSKNPVFWQIRRVIYNTYCTTRWLLHCTGWFRNKCNYFESDAIEHWQKKLRMNVRLILNGYLIQQHKWKSNGDSCLCCWINSEDSWTHQTNRWMLLLLPALRNMKTKSAEQHAIFSHTRHNCTAVHGGVFGHLIVDCNKFVT